MLLLHSLCLLAAVTVASGIECYSCKYVKKGDNEYADNDSGYYADCGNENDHNIESLPKVSCDGHCFKSVATNSDDDVMCVERGCFDTTQTSSDKCPETQESFGIQCGVPTDGDSQYVLADRYCCDTELCNGSSVLAASVMCILLALILSY